MILVTGATGNVGSALVDCLRAHQIAFRVAAHGLKHGPPLSVEGVEAIKLDFLDPETFRAAVRGCDAVFLMRPPAIADMRATPIPFFDVARAAGVRQVVFLSVAGAGDNPLVPHHAAEQHLRCGPPCWTILRPGFFAQNFGDAYRRDIARHNRVFVPAGRGKVTFVDVRDVAEVAVLSLVDPATHQGQTYTLTGPEALSFAETAHVLSRELGRVIRYQPASIADYFFHLQRRKMPLSQILVQTLLHVGLCFGQGEAVDGTLGRLLERPPRIFGCYVRDHRELWL